jgi:hypothetical protein
MLQDANDPAWPHALPGPFDFPFSLSPSFSLHRRRERKVFVPPHLFP